MTQRVLRVLLVISVVCVPEITRLPPLSEESLHSSCRREQFVRFATQPSCASHSQWVAGTTRINRIASVSYDPRLKAEKAVPVTDLAESCQIVP